MTTYAFTPTIIGPPTYQWTLDGGQYTAVIEWNLFGARYYVRLVTLRGAPVFNLPLIGSPDNYDINIGAGYFTDSTIVFRSSTQSFDVLP